MNTMNVKYCIVYSILFLLGIVTIYTFWINTCTNPAYLLCYDGRMSLFFPCIFISFLLLIARILYITRANYFLVETILFSVILFLCFTFITLYNGNFVQTIKNVWLHLIYSRFTGIQLVTISSIYAIFLLYFTKYSRAIVSGIFIAIACVDYGKRCFFNDHLYIQDFYLINKDFLEVVFPFIKEYTDIVLIAICSCIVLYSVKNKISWKPDRNLKISCCVLVLCIASIFANNIFLFEKDQKNFFVVGYSWYYTETGFLTGFLNNIRFSPYKKFVSFSDDDIKHVNEYFMNVQQTDVQSLRPNILIWQEESYDDLRKYPSMTIPHSVYEKYDLITQEAAYGYTLTPQYYTINSQFEVMSGLFYNYFGPEMAILTKNTYPLTFALGYALQKNGYITGSLHHAYPSTFNAKTKKGESLYGVIESFKLTKTAEVYEKTKYTSSMSYAQEALKIIKEHYLPAKRPFALFVQTDQNHTPHTRSNLNNSPQQVLFNGHYHEQLSVYAHGLKSSNDALFFLINELKKINEPIVLLFYGDHNTFSGLNDPKSNVLDNNTTSFFIWSNYKHTSVKYPTTSHAYLGIELFKYIGLPMNRYQLFMNEVQNICRGMNFQVSIDGHGNICTLDKQNSLLRMQKIFQYDVTSGKNALSKTASEIVQ